MSEVIVTEVWKDVQGYEGLYQVSNLGRMKSLGRRKRIMKPMELKAHSNTYFRIALFKDGKYKYRFLHRVVLETFVGPCQEGKECRHLDGNPENNRLDNLAWGTPKENGEDKVRQERNCPGIKNGNSKLNEEKVREIRRLHETGMYGIRQLGRMFLTDSANVRSIVDRLTWKHIT